MSKRNDPVPACGHLFWNRKCRLCRLPKEQRERAWYAAGYRANTQNKPITAWPRIDQPYSGEWYRCKNCWQAGWLAAQSRPELPIDEWTRKNTPSSDKPPKPNPKHRIEDRLEKHGLNMKDINSTSTKAPI